MNLRGILFLLSLSALTLAAAPISVSDADQKKMLTDLDTSLKALSEAMSNCVAKGEAKESCLCRNKELGTSLQKKFELTVTKYPHWKKASVTTITPAGQTLYIDMETLEAQLRLQCKEITDLRSSSSSP